MIRITFIFLVSGLTLSFTNCSEKVGAPLSYDPPGATNTKSKRIQSQKKQTLTLGGVTASNEFDGARMNAIRMLKATIFQVTIAPENAPINMSPWYAFKMKSNREKRIHIHMLYKDGKHRYYPDISNDGLHWNPFDSTLYKVWPNDSAVLTIDLTPIYTWIDAQELQTSAMKKPSWHEIKCY